MSTLLEIGDDLRALATLIDEGDGELRPDTEQALESWFADQFPTLSQQVAAYLNDPANARELERETEGD